MAATYYHHLLVKSTDIDEMNHVNNVVYVQWVQEAAAAHWNAQAPIEVKTKFNWVVMRHEIDYRSPALLNDELTAKTWVDNYDGAKSTRIVQIIRKKDEKLLAEARTTWCLLNASTNRPIRAGDEIKTVFGASSDDKFD
ncbi:MAG TPA: acyl-CoA thioesterase [Cyclobacteriaceae bacterium]